MTDRKKAVATAQRRAETRYLRVVRTVDGLLDQLELDLDWARSGEARLEPNRVSADVKALLRAVQDVTKVEGELDALRSAQDGGRGLDLTWARLEITRRLGRLATGGAG